MLSSLLLQVLDERQRQRNPTVLIHRIWQVELIVKVKKDKELLKEVHLVSNFTIISLSYLSFLLHFWFIG
jgi:hypothetical protein